MYVVLVLVPRGYFQGRAIRRNTADRERQYCQLLRRYSVRDRWMTHEYGTLVK